MPLLLICTVLLRIRHTLVVRGSWSLGSNFEATPHTPSDRAQQSVVGHWTVHACVQCNVCIAVSDSASQGRRELVEKAAVDVFYLKS